MITEIEDYFTRGCGRCGRFDTPDCSARRWQEGIVALRVNGSAWPTADRLAPFQYLVGAAPAVAAAGRPPRDVALLASGAETRASVQAAFAAGANGIIGWPSDMPTGNDFTTLDAVLRSPVEGA